MTTLNQVCFSILKTISLLGYWNRTTRPFSNIIFHTILDFPTAISCSQFSFAYWGYGWSSAPQAYLSQITLKLLMEDKCTPGTITSCKITFMIEHIGKVILGRKERRSLIIEPE